MLDLRKKKLTASQMMDRLAVDDRTSEPYYKQLMRRIEDLIDTGEMTHGLSLPSERDLAEALNLSRTTVKRCYDELRHTGLLNANGRNGTSVNSPQSVSPPLGRLKGFTEEMQEMGMVPSTRIESSEVWKDRTIASIFQRHSDAPFLRLVRVRLADGMPMAREVAWYDLNAAPQLEAWDMQGSIYAYLQEHCNISLGWAEQSIEATLSSEIETKTFDFQASTPCLFMKRRTYMHTGKLIEYVEGTFRGDAYVYRVKLDV